MKCPACLNSSKKTQVIDSRTNDRVGSIRRRRVCSMCGYRFTTTERMDTGRKKVKKSNGEPQEFDVDKLRASIEKATAKRYGTADKVDDLVLSIQKRLLECAESVIDSSRLAEWAMHGLRGLDEIAYVRYAANYRKFNDAGPQAKSHNIPYEQIDIFASMNKAD